MSKATEFEVVTWACDNGWERRTCSANGTRHWCQVNDDSLTFYPDILAEMTRQFEEAHKPSLAERVADCVWSGRAGGAPLTWQEARDAVQKILDEEPEGQDVGAVIERYKELCDTALEQAFEANQKRMELLDKHEKLAERVADTVLDTLSRGCVVWDNVPRMPLRDHFTAAVQRVLDEDAPRTGDET